jgi:hypothetical protein
MLVLVPFFILFVMLGLLWFLGGALFVGTVLAKVPRVLGRALEHDEKNCACYLGLKHHGA